MKKNAALLTALILSLSGQRALALDDFIDQLDDHLAFSTMNGNLSARFSGLLDMETYVFQQPAPGLIYSGHDYLFSPRLSLFLDARIGETIYAFAELRVDRGFDPSDSNVEAGFDQYAVRYTPLKDGRLNIQIGKFATVVGNWVQRHYSWENPFVTAPLVYENVTKIYDSEAPSSARDFVGPPDGAKYEYNPVIWGPSYASGLSVTGVVGKFEYAAEMKNAPLASRPEAWDVTNTGFQHPTFSGRLGFRPNEMWTFGFSASDGAYFRQEAASTLPAGTGIGDYREILLGQDIGFAWHHLQFWAEFYEIRFQVPRVGNADAFSYYLEAKYKFTPQLFGALRWNQQLYGSVPDGEGGTAAWDKNIWRIDTALGYRFTPHTQFKLQYSLQSQPGSARDINLILAAQFTVKF
jgi:hypothetical protein